MSGIESAERKNHDERETGIAGVRLWALGFGLWALGLDLNARAKNGNWDLQAKCNPVDPKSPEPKA